MEKGGGREGDRGKWGEGIKQEGFCLWSKTKILVPFPMV